MPVQFIVISTQPCIATRYQLAFSLQTALELLGLSDKYDFPELKGLLEDKLKSITDLTNALQFYFYADL